MNANAKKTSRPPKPKPNVAPEPEPEAELNTGPFMVANQTAHLSIPARVTNRLAVLSLLGDPSVGRDSHAYTLLAAAALLLCWPTGQVKLKIPYTHRLLDYGAELVERLVEEGAEIGHSPQQTYNEILEAGDAAIHLILSTLPKKQHLEDAEGNSEGSTAPGSANSSP